MVRSGPELGAILELLDNGDQAEARARIVAVLRVADGGAPIEPQRIEAVLTSLDHTRAARRAVREGRVTDLVTSARAACDTLDPALPWLAMYAGSLLQAAFRFTGDPALHDAALDALRRVADRTDAPEAAVPARAMMASVHLLSGAYHTALSLCDAALELAAVRGLDDRPPAALAHQFRGYVLFEWNRLDEAQSALRRAWDASDEGNAGVRSGVARVAAELAAALGRRADAEVWLARLESIVAEPMTLRNREWLTAVRVRHALGTGDLRAIDDWLRTWDYRPETLVAADDGHLVSRLHELDGLLTVFEATERWHDLVALAPRIHEVAHDRRRWFDARALSAWAVALEAAGLVDEADARFEAALAAGDRGSFVRVYIEGSDLRKAILLRLARHNRANAHALRVLAALPDRESECADVLTERQLDVLRLVEQGCSNKAIARELGLSLSTVKTHLRTAFVRLDAVSRTQAIALARRRGLL